MAQSQNLLGGKLELLAVPLGTDQCVQLASKIRFSEKPSLITRFSIWIQQVEQFRQLIDTQGSIQWGGGGSFSPSAPSFVSRTLHF